MVIWLVPTVSNAFCPDKAIELDQEADEESKEESKKLEYLDELASLRGSQFTERSNLLFPWHESDLLNGFDKEMINPPD